MKPAFASIKGGTVKNRISIHIRATGIGYVALLFLAGASFFSVGGGTALASYVVSSNSQIGPNTVSGHKPPSGKHANLIGGSVNATDLANGAATLAKLAANSVNGSKVVNGSLTGLDLAAPFRLPVGCGASQVPKWTGKAWTCATDQNSGGTITGVTTSGGLTGGGSSDQVDVGVDPTQIQSRVTGSCAPGSAVQSVAFDGTVGCGATNPSGSAGGALAGDYPNPSLNVSGGDSGATACKNGEAITGLSGSAALTCNPGVYSDGNANVAAGPSPFGALTTASGNVAVGSSTLQSDTTGSRNSAVGQGALQSDSNGIDNSAVGNGALGANANGSGNSALGRSALAANVSGGGNSALGRGALQSNTGASNNSAVGSLALANSTGGNNSAIGQAALLMNTGGGGNSALGQNALQSNTTGNFNTAIGDAAGANLTTGSDNIDIGAFVYGASGESNTIRLGNQGTQTKAFMAGVFGTSTGGAASPVLVDSNGQLGTTSSSRRFKRDIHPIGSAASGLMRLRPVSFRYRHGFVHGSTPPQFGLIAEQVARVYPHLVVDGADGKPSAVAYQELPALELAQLQREHLELRHQRARNRSQSGQIRAQRTRIQRQDKHNRSQDREIARLRRAVARLSQHR